jgi:hypothetical protein
LVPVFAFMIPGLREVVLVAIVATALYGRSGTRLLMATRYGRSLSPWLRLIGVGTPARGRATAAAAARAATRQPVPPRRRGKYFWAFTLTALAALAAWIATRMMIPHALSAR